METYTQFYALWWLSPTFFPCLPGWTLATWNPHFEIGKLGQIFFFSYVLVWRCLFYQIVLLSGIVCMLSCSVSCFFFEIFFNQEMSVWSSHNSLKKLEMEKGFPSLILSEKTLNVCKKMHALLCLLPLLDLGFWNKIYMYNCSSMSHICIGTSCMLILFQQKCVSVALHNYQSYTNQNCMGECALLHSFKGTSSTVVVCVYCYFPFGECPFLLDRL